MKVGDLVKFKNSMNNQGFLDKAFLVVRAEPTVVGKPQRVWIYPDADPEGLYDHTDEYNYYYDRYFEVISGSR